jgi:hypothetical protein
MESQNDKKLMGDLGPPWGTKKVPALNVQELKLFSLMDLFTH